MRLLLAFAEPDSQGRRSRARAVTEKAAGTTSASSVMILTEQFACLPLPKPRSIKA